MFHGMEVVLPSLHESKRSCQGQQGNPHCRCPSPVHRGHSGDCQSTWAETPLPSVGGEWVRQLRGGAVCLLPQCWKRGFDPWAGKITWRRKWQPTPILLPGKFHGLRSLVGYSPWGCQESDMTDRLHSLLGRKVMTNLDSILKSRDITLPTKVHLVKPMVFPLVMYGYESWTTKKAEH